MKTSAIKSLRDRINALRAINALSGDKVAARPDKCASRLDAGRRQISITLGKRSVTQGGAASKHREVLHRSTGRCCIEAPGGAASKLREELHRSSGKSCIEAPGRAASKLREELHLAYGRVHVMIVDGIASRYTPTRYASSPERHLSCVGTHGPAGTSPEEGNPPHTSSFIPHTLIINH